MKIFFRLLAYTKPYHHFIPEYIIYALLGAIFGLLNFTLLIPLLNLLFNTIDPLPLIQKPTFSWTITYIKNIFNYHFYSLIQTHGKMAALLLVCAIIFCSVLLSNVFKYLSMRVMGRIKLRMLEGIRNNIFNVLLNQDLAFHYKNHKGQLVSVLMNDVQELESGVGNTIQNLLRAPFILILYMATLFYLSASLTIFTLIFFPLSALLISFTMKKLKRQGHFSQEFLGRMLTAADETFSGIKIIKAFQAQNHLLKKFLKLNKTFSNISRKMFYQRELASPLSEFLGVAIMVILVIYGGYLITSGSSTLTGAIFIGYLAIYSQMIPPIKDISICFSYIHKAIASGERIFAIIDHPQTLTSNPASNTTPNPLPFEFKKDIVFKNVSFKYQDDWVLQNINLTINKGETIAIVGKSGSGKTTLIDLILHFYEAQQGDILLDGQNIKDIPTTQLKNLISIVTQEPFLFHDNVYNNITFNNQKSTKEQVEQAAKMAFAHDFIQQLEQGYYTDIGERGMKLSGGQRQRITIARALFNNPAILILDEATASLDSESEKHVQQALENAMKQRTAIIIAHRLSTIQNAHKIVVLEKGKIVEIGTHHQLIAQNGNYADLIKMQAFK